MIAKVVAAHPEKSDRQIAKEVKADHKTVSARAAAELVHHWLSPEARQPVAEAFASLVRPDGERNEAPR
jgi:hypothetical protein